MLRSKSISPAPPAASTVSEKSIAVLPFLNEGGDAGDEYFSDGLSEELIAALAQIGDLKVIGRSSSFRFKGKNEESKTIGEKLGVRTLLEGTVRKQGGAGADRRRTGERQPTESSFGHERLIVNSRIFSPFRRKSRTAVAESLKVTLLGSEDRSAQKQRPRTPKRIMLICGVTSIFSAGISTTIAKRSVTSMRRSGWILIMPWPMPSVPKRGR